MRYVFNLKQFTPVLAGPVVIRLLALLFVSGLISCVTFIIEPLLLSGCINIRASYAWEDICTCHTWEMKTHSVSVCLPPTSKACSLAERSERLSGKDSSLWSPDLSGSSRISVCPGILNMHTGTEHSKGMTRVPEEEKGKKMWQWWPHWCPTIPAFHP